MTSIMKTINGKNLTYLVNLNGKPAMSRNKKTVRKNLRSFHTEANSKKILEAHASNQGSNIPPTAGPPAGGAPPANSNANANVKAKAKANANANALAKEESNRLEKAESNRIAKEDHNRKAQAEQEERNRLEEERHRQHSNSMDEITPYSVCIVDIGSVNSNTGFFNNTISSSSSSRNSNKLHKSQIMKQVDKFNLFVSKEFNAAKACVESSDLPYNLEFYGSVSDGNTVGGWNKLDGTYVLVLSWKQFGEKTEEPKVGGGAARTGGGGPSIKVAGANVPKEMFVARKEHCKEILNVLQKKNKINDIN